MNILGVSASRREWGNTDILVRQALRGSAAEGAETRFLRLTELCLEPCSGCMACVFKDRDCVREDRFPEFLAALRWADAVVLGSPTYILGATAAVKNLQDRMLRFGMHREFVGRPGLALASAGVRGWEPFALPQVSLFFLFLGMPLVDQFVGYGQGPGEVLEDKDAMTRAREGGRALGLGQTEYRGEAGSCPVCHFDLVTTRGDGSGYCSLCDLPGEWDLAGSGPRFLPRDGCRPRWSEASLEHHFGDRVLPSGPRFRERLREVRAAVDAFREGV